MLLCCFLSENQLKIYNNFINITEEDISQEFRLKKNKRNKQLFY